MIAPYGLVRFFYYPPCKGGFAIQNLLNNGPDAEK